MASKLEYDLGMGRWVSATVAVFGLLLVASLATAQANGVPASVTSVGFGGHFTAGVPASVTSLGPNGFHGRASFFTQPQCCVNTPFPHGRGNGSFHHHRGQLFFPGTPVYSLPYTPVVVVPGDDEAMYPDEVEADDDRGGPTIFDRRGSGQYERDRYSERYQEQDRGTPASDQPQPASASTAPITEQAPTILVFKDGHTVEVQNYAILGTLVYDLTPGHPRKIPLADLDLEATAKQNDDRGIDFRLPAAN